VVARCLSVAGVTKLQHVAKNLPAASDKALDSMQNIFADTVKNQAGADVSKATRGNIFNSFWFIGLLVFTAVLVTTVGVSAPIERNPSVIEKNLIHSHFKALSHTGELSLRSPQRN
jgi:hypothetical protein